MDKFCQIRHRGASEECRCFSDLGLSGELGKLRPSLFLCTSATLQNWIERSAETAAESRGASGVDDMASTASCCFPL